MYDPNFSAPPPPPPEVRKYSPLGIISFVLSILALGLVCLFFIYAYILGSDASTVSTGASVIGWVFICGVSLFTLAGLGLGIAAVVQPAQNKVFGILGLVFNALILIGFCLFMLFAVFVAASMPGYY
ncbi:MAG: hypothetical protein HY781_13890 [Chloroflexi bacterium]|nr:hypothetical protein [Chloroflexota bacterium]